MIKISVKEYSKRGIAYCEKVVSLFNIPIYKRTDTTTNKEVVNNLNKSTIK